jgi:hypothetical protein
VEQYVADTSLMRMTLGLRPEPPLTYLPEMACEALRREHGDDYAATITVTSARRPHLTLVGPDGL